MAVLLKPFLVQGMGACCYLLFSVGRETIWLHKRRAAALALPMVGPELGFLKASAHSINGKVSAKHTKPSRTDTQHAEPWKCSPG